LSPLRLVAACLALFAANPPALASEKAEKKLSKEEKAKLPRLAILDFPAGPNAWNCHGWGNHEAQMSDAIRELFVTEIMDGANGKLRLVERARLDAIKGELAMQQSGDVDAATAQKVGKLLGAKYMLTGKITRFACKLSGASTGWGVGAVVGKLTKSNLAGDVAGSVSMKKATFSGRLDVRLIEVETGEILGAFKEEGSTGDTSVKVAGGGTDVDYDDELVGKVFEPVVQAIAPKVVKKTVKVGKEAAEDEDE
jgi:curli biogenesis system outer membrane secretion channel CsgG